MGTLAGIHYIIPVFLKRGKKEVLKLTMTKKRYHRRFLEQGIVAYGIYLPNLYILL